MKTLYLLLSTCFFCFLNKEAKAQDGAIQSIIINEIMPRNNDMFVDPSWNYGAFVELYNPTDQRISLSNNYISDDSNNLKKWRLPITIGGIPAKSYKTLWFDHYDKDNKNQIGFNLDIDGGIIIISDKEGNIIASQEYPESYYRCSYARTQTDGYEWKWSSTPTPGKTNESMEFAEEQLPTPEVSQEGQIFSKSFLLTINIPDGATLRYTTDGSVPTLTNGNTNVTGLFSISSTKAYRFRFFKEGFLPSEIKTCSYIFEEKDFCTPIISIVTDNSNIYGNDYGIWVRGNGNGRAGRGQSSKCNWNMDWDRPVTFQYINSPKENEVCFSQEVNMAACGGWSRAWEPHSFKLKANKTYGLSYMPYAFFEEKPYIKNKTLQIRNGGNDNNCRIIDAAIQSVISRSGINVDCQSYKPVFVYVNGKFYNVLNMREPNNKHFAYANKGLDDKEMDQFEYCPDSGYVQMEGTRDAFELWYKLSANASRKENYEQIKQIVDIDEFINYFAIEMYLGSSDWINNSNNVKGYRPNTANGKFRFTIFDLDAAGGSDEFNSVENNRWHTGDNLFDGSARNYYEIELITIWLNMLRNEQFRKQFIDAFCLVTGSIFTPERCKNIINEVATDAEKALSQAGASPWGSANNLINTFNKSRQETMISKLQSYSKMKLSGIKSITASISSNLASGRLILNGQSIPTNTFSGKLFLPINLNAEAPAGYKFSGWKAKTINSNTIFENNTAWSYYDKGSLDNKNWKSASYSISSWGNGNAPLGYATGSTWTTYTTKLDYGTDANNKRPTYYFRKNFTLTNEPAKNEEYKLSITVDDGCIIYVNGTEVGRFNMPNGNVSYNTYASTYGDQFSYPQSIQIKSSLLKKGTNIIAVEVHNNDNKSSDIHWEASLECYSSEDISISETPEISLENDINIQAIFTKLDTESCIEQKYVPIRINEISASNSIYVNDYFKKEDWIELYNTTDKEIDLEGMFLSDKVDKPYKFQFKKGDVSTIIEPNGYKIIWCDKKDNTTQLHTNFKLGNDDGSYVLLTSSDSIWSDTLQYNAHNGDVTIGRYPDGSNSVFMMYYPSIGKSNQMTTYDEYQTEIRPTSIEDVKNNITNKGNLSIAYVNGYILIKSGSSNIVELSISSLSGQIISRHNLPLSSGHASYYVQLQKGIYVANVIDAEGNKCSTKFFIK